MPSSQFERKAVEGKLNIPFIFPTWVGEKVVSMMILVVRVMRDY